MAECLNNLSYFAEQISDDFHSTFTVVSDNVLVNMLGLDNDIENLTTIIKKYIPDANLQFIKSGKLNSTYDIYYIRQLVPRAKNEPT